MVKFDFNRTTKTNPILQKLQDKTINLALYASNVSSNFKNRYRNTDIMKKALSLLIFLFFTTCINAQLFSRKQKDLGINYSYTNINDSVRIKRTPQSEKKKLLEVDRDLL